MKKDKDRKVGPPPAYRLRLFFGRPAGLRWVPDNHLGVVYRMEMYQGLRGPGFFRINPFTESVKRQVNLNPDFITTPIPSLNTRDAVQLGLQVALAYVFDPRTLPPDKAMIYVKWPRHILRAIVTNFTIGALLSITPKYYAEQICRGELFETIEQSLMDELTNRLRPLAIRPTFDTVLEVIVPPPLQDTFTAVANRTAYTHDLSLFEPFELSEVERRELNEVLKELPGGIRYLNVMAGDVGSSQWQDSRRFSQQTIRGTSRPLPNQMDIDDDDLTQSPVTSTRSHLPPPATPAPTELDTGDDESPKRPGISRKSHL
jgi:hypothetical protein